ncbi:MAG TPA: hypothetical protein VF556_03235 [Pyrinomonadaceae bacterium]|jgi:hypothetical protein
MARRNLRPTGNNIIEYVSQELEFFKKTPLSKLASIIEEEISLTNLAVERGEFGNEVLNNFASRAKEVLKVLPKSYKARFEFDAQLTDAISQEWNHQKQVLSMPILPKHGGNHWEHGKLTLPIKRKLEHSNSYDSSLAVTVIRFPGEDNLDSINLLDYPFLYHELAHNLFFYNDDRYFADAFKKKLNEYLSKLRLRSFADQGSAKDKSLKMIDKVQQMWKPTASHHNWAHEMAMDLVSLWSCGPAYLAAFQDELENYPKDWFYLEPNHPPYLIRVESLINAAHKLGWHKYTEEADRLLSQRIRQWRQTKRKDTNTFVTLTPAELIEDCISSVFSTCENFALPRCTSDDVERVKTKFAKNQNFDFGTELIIAAWFYQQQTDNDEFTRWERKTIRALMSSLTQ